MSKAVLLFLVVVLAGANLALFHYGRERTVLPAVAAAPAVTRPNTVQAPNLVRSAIAPLISATVMTAKVSWKAMKVKAHYQTLKEDIALCEEIRKQAGDDFVIMVDANKAGLRQDFHARGMRSFQARCEAYPEILLSPQLDLERSQAELVRSVRMGPGPR